MKQQEQKQLTELKIKTAFIELLPLADQMSDITVKSIIERAQISRGTFYSHFVDVYAVLEVVEHDLLRKIGISIRQSLEQAVLSADVFIDPLTIIASEQVELRALLRLSNGSQAHHVIRKELVELIDDSKLYQRYAVQTKLPLKYAQAIFVDHILELLIFWLKDDDADSVPVFAEIIWQSLWMSPIDLFK